MVRAERTRVNCEKIRLTLSISVSDSSESKAGYGILPDDVHLFCYDHTSSPITAIFNSA
jgi:hypothetical protein